MPSTNALANPPTLDDLPATPDRADRATFAVRCTALFDHLKNTTLPQWREALIWTNAAAAEIGRSADEAASYAKFSSSSADAAAGSAATAASTLAAAQTALGAARWRPGPYEDGECAWSPTNGRLYRTRMALPASAVDPITDRDHWFDLSQAAMAIGYVNDTYGHFYGVPNGGLNMVNVIQFGPTRCAKQLPAQPANGDVCVVAVANGRSDNEIHCSGAPIAVGPHLLTSHLVIDAVARPITFQFFAARQEWRVM